MPNDLDKQLEPFLAALARLFAAAGKPRDVAILVNAKASIEQTGYDNWDGGQYMYTIYLQVPASLFAQLGDEIPAIEKNFHDKAQPLIRLYPCQHIQEFIISTEIAADDDWRDKAKTWLTGKGMTNQGRVRSDNIAGKTSDGLLFRSQPEINLYKALKALGVTFAPLPVFVRGGQSYRRIEPDFVLLREGIVLIVEVDGDTVHQETPAEAHDRTTMLAHEGAFVERVTSDTCDTEEKARSCADRLLAVMKKHKANQ